MEAGDDERDAHGGSGKTDMYSMINALGKSKLSAFVTSTATVGYVMCGGASPVVGTVITLGTYLQSLSANTCNQVIEVEHDGRMKRTMKRPLVTGAISRPAALGIAALELSLGTAMIYYYSPLAAGLGVLNWALYVGMYTPLKRVSTTNTWWGAIVGAIPPVMGGAAALPGISMADPLMYPAHLLGALLFAWQIPHFMSLAYHCRRDYEGAGYKMLPYTHPWRASAYAVALSVVMAILSVPAPYFVCPVVEPWFYPLSLAANTVMIIKAVNFHLDPKTYCRSCFVFSYMWLGAVLLLLGVNHMQPMGRFCALIGWVVEDVPVVAAAAATDGSSLRLLREQSPVVALAGGPKAL
jgi:protoheme IX farnesyltransferase